MREKEKLITKEYLNTVFTYVYETGELLWKIRRCKCRLGGVAGHIDKHGYRIIKLDYIRHKAHRVVWIYNYGNIPDNMEIDHKDRDKSNNRLENLRLATKQQNSQHRGKPLNCSSVFSGVSWNIRDKVWQVKYTEETGKLVHGGNFDSELAAAYHAEKMQRKVKGEFYNEYESVDSVLKRQLINEQKENI